MQYDFVPDGCANYGLANDPQGPPTPAELKINLDLLGCI